MLGHLLKCRVPLQPRVKLAGEAVELHTVLPIQTLSSSPPEASVLPNCPSVPVRMSNAEKNRPDPENSIIRPPADDHESQNNQPPLSAMTPEEFSLCCRDADINQPSSVSLRAFKNFAASCPSSEQEANTKPEGLTKDQQLSVLKLVCVNLCTRPLESSSKLFKSLRNLCKKIRFFERSNTVTDILLTLLTAASESKSARDYLVEGCMPLAIKGDDHWIRVLTSLKHPGPKTITTTQDTYCYSAAVAKDAKKIALTSIAYWNVNGFSTRWLNKQVQVSVEKAHYPTMMVFTETKCGWEQLQKLPGFEDWLNSNGYNYVFSHWSSDVKKNRHGHAGLLFISKIEPVSMKSGVNNAKLDKEARIIIAEFEHFHFVGGYLPCAYPQPARVRESAPHTPR